MLNLINEFLGISIIETMGIYLGTFVVCLFGFLALEFLIQLVLIFWRWLFRVR